MLHSPCEHGRGGRPGTASNPRTTLYDGSPSQLIALLIGRRLAGRDVLDRPCSLRLGHLVGDLAAQDRPDVAPQVGGVVFPGALTLVELGGGSLLDIALDEGIDGKSCARLLLLRRGILAVGNPP